MKKYFLKWLPVEGEIRANDFAKSEYGIGKVNTGEYGTYIYYEDEHGEGVNVLLSVHKDTPLKVKLFLCSRDIQVGDKVRCQKDNFEKEYLVEQDGQIVGAYCLQLSDSMGLFRPEHLIKVIGEISPNAYTFAKEGMEYNDSEVKIEWYLSFENAPILPPHNSVVWTADEDGSLKSGLYFKKQETAVWIPEKSTNTHYCVLNCSKPFLIPRTLGIEKNYARLLGPCQHFH